MARMIPATIHLAVRSGAERLMFNARSIKGAVRTENWICLHSFGLARHPSKRLGEIDFVLVTTHGLFVPEVKGGRTRRQGGGRSPCGPFWSSRMGLYRSVRSGTSKQRGSIRVGRY